MTGSDMIRGFDRQKPNDGEGKGKASPAHKPLSLAKITQGNRETKAFLEVPPPSGDSNRGSSRPSSRQSFNSADLSQLSSGPMTRSPSELSERSSRPDQSALSSRSSQSAQSQRHEPSFDLPDIHTNPGGKIESFDLPDIHANPDPPSSPAGELSPAQRRKVKALFRGTRTE